VLLGEGDRLKRPDDDEEEETGVVLYAPRYLVKNKVKILHTVSQQMTMS